MKILVPLAGVIGILGIVSGSCFKILHLPGANELLLAGFFVSIGVFIPLVLIQRYHKPNS